MKQYFKKVKCKKVGTALLMMLVPILSLHAQLNITGNVVSSEEDEPLIGVTVTVQGTTTGTITDADGNYSITAESDEVLVFSYVGYKTQEIPVDGRTNINVVMEPDVLGMEEVVVVGYGTQRTKDLTSAIATVNADDIVKTPASQAMQALQGKVAGVQIVNSGAPGSSPTVRIRGIGSLPGYGDSDPLYVVDGMFYEDIDFLNTSDIQSISVLKDASAAAIYGVRAANGVVLIETKSGNYNQEPKVQYTGYYGYQRAQNILEMANTKQFFRYIDETGAAADMTFIENAIDRYGANPNNPELPAPNTDWYEEVLRLGPIQNHSLSVTGGSQRAKYSVGASYFSQEGLLKEIKNEYERMNFRTKVDFNASDRLTVGGNVNLSNSIQYNAPDAVWFNTYFAVPVIPVYDEENMSSVASPIPIANAQNLGYRGTQNPFFILHYNNDRNKEGDILGNFYFDYDILPERLSFKMTYNYNYGTLNRRNIDFAHNTGQEDKNNALYRRNVTTLNQIWDNILTYEQSFGNHDITLMGGYSYRTETMEGVFARAAQIDGLNREDEELWFISGAGGGAAGQIDEGQTGDVGGSIYGVSYLSRLSYNYADRYLLYGTYRRDGTNKFQAKWGNFFTLGAGWVVSSESFFDVDFVDYLKIRGSWGELGNDAVRPAVGQPTRESIFFALDDTRNQGVTLDYAYDKVTKWETVVESNIGITSRFLDGRLSLEGDYYVRETRDAVTELLVPGQRTIIRRSLASLKNSGLELVLEWSDDITDKLSYAVSGNMATLENEVLDLGPGPGYLDAGSAEFRQRSIEGNTVEAYFGYEVEGIFQSEQQIQNSGYTDEFISNKRIEPGDFHFKDQNNDGVIDAKDRVVLGSYLPDLTYGMSLNITYGNFNLSSNIQGQTGHQILNRKRGEIIWSSDPNIDAELAKNLWRGRGTSNKYPSAAGLRKGYNQQMSEYYLEDGSYFRIQNVRLSYTVADKTLFGVEMPQTTFNITAERPVTIFDYNGFNPEVPDGYDRQTYPVPAVYTAGLTMNF